MSPWVINRDKSVFGDDAEDFRPERWLDERKKHDMRKCDYFPEQVWLRGLSLLSVIFQTASSSPLVPDRGPALGRVSTTWLRNATDSCLHM